MSLNVRNQFVALSILVAAGFSSAVAQTEYSIGDPTPEQQAMLELINGRALMARRKRPV